MNFEKNETILKSLYPLIPPPQKKKNVTPAISIEFNPALSKNTPIYPRSDERVFGERQIDPTRSQKIKNKKIKMRVGQKQNILEAIQVLNGPLVNTQ